MLFIVLAAGSRPLRRCTTRWICWHHCGTDSPSRETGARPARSAITSPSRRTSMLNPGVGIFPPNSMMRNTHQATSRRIGSGNGDRSTPARQVPSWQNAPANSGGTLDSSKRDSRIGSGTAAHRSFQRPRVAAVADRFHPVDHGLCAPAGHEPDPICSSQCVLTRQPTVNAFQSATARIWASSVTCA